MEGMEARRQSADLIMGCEVSDADHAGFLGEVKVGGVVDMDFAVLDQRVYLVFSPLIMLS